VSEIYSIGVPDQPAEGVRMLSVSVAVPFGALSDAAAWAAAMEAVRLRLLEDPAVIAAGGGQ
tara:strand:- start:280 stop:465 length:186 start_codon:yes stop_codon:yes gene_type:complete